MLLVLSSLYAAVFTQMVYVSLLEQVIAPHSHLPRYAGQVHYHNAPEWMMLVGPAAIGWIVLLGSLTYLVRHLARRR